MTNLSLEHHAAQFDQAMQPVTTKMPLSKAVAHFLTWCATVPCPEADPEGDGGDMLMVEYGLFPDMETGEEAFHVMLSRFLRFRERDYYKLHRPEEFDEICAEFGGEEDWIDCREVQCQVVLQFPVTPGTTELGGGCETCDPGDDQAAIGETLGGTFAAVYL